MAVIPNANAQWKERSPLRYCSTGSRYKSVFKWEGELLDVSRLSGDVFKFETEIFLENATIKPIRLIKAM